MRAEFLAVETAMNKLPGTLTPNYLVVVNAGGTGLTVSDNSAYVTLTGTLTLTNKTLTAPTITNPTVSTGTFTSPTLVTPALGTPASGVMTNVTGTAASLTAGAATVLATARDIYGNSFNGSAALTAIIASTYGGTGNGFAKFSGPTTSEKTFTLPNASTTIVTTGATANVTVGYTNTPANLGSITSFTLDPTLGNLQYGTNNAAATWTAPASDCSMVVLVTNGASAGSITFSGFTVSASTGDALTTTNTSKFVISILRVNSVSTYVVKALQ